MQHRERPIEGTTDGEATTPRRTADNVPASNVTPREAKTMAAAPFVFGGIALLIAIIVMVVLFALK